MTKAAGRSRPKGVSIVWSARAVADLRAIDDYIASDNPEAAARWVGRIVERAEKASRAPKVGRIVPEKGRTDIREVFVRTYRIVYRVRERGITVLTVFEGHRLFSSTTVDTEEE